MRDWDLRMSTSSANQITWLNKDKTKCTIPSKRLQLKWSWGHSHYEHAKYPGQDAKYTSHPMPFHAQRSAEYARDRPPRNGWLNQEASRYSRNVKLEQPCITSRETFNCRLGNSPTIIVKTRWKKRPIEKEEMRLICSFILFRLFKKEVGSELFVLVAGEIGLDRLVSWKS